MVALRFSRESRQQWLISRQRIVAGVSLVGFLVAVVGVPLPAYRFKPTDQAYPCMHHACGCADAKHCWKDCCCFTQQEKLAWARAHDVTPPSFLVADCEEHGGHDHEHVHSHATENAASSIPPPTVTKSGRRSCCHKAEPCETSGEAANQDKAAPEQTGMALVVSSNFHQCHGLPQLWTVLGASTGPPHTISYSFNWSVIEWLSTSSITAISCVAPPPTPPPLA